METSTINSNRAKRGDIIKFNNGCIGIYKFSYDINLFKKNSLRVMSATTTPKKKSKRIFYFDLLRSLAIISVILYHINLSIRILVVGELTPFPSFSWFLSDFFMADNLNECF